MAMVTEMRIPGGDRRERFNYKGMHRYLMTFIPAHREPPVAERETVIRLLAALREACRAQRFDVYAYAFLPDRLALIIRGKTDDADMRAWVAAFRAASDTNLGELRPVPVWSRRYTERVLRKTEDSQLAAAALYRLAVTAGLASSPDAYPFQGSFANSDPFGVERKPRREGPPQRGRPRPTGGKKPPRKFDKRQPKRGR
jgi:hypothetical protein